MTAIPKEKKALLTVDGLSVVFPWGRRTSIEAVSGVRFHINRGETVGLVGESGCGKSTLARSIVGLQKPTAGKILFEDEDLTRCSANRLRAIRTQIQMIFQDAIASLNPGRRIGKTIEEPLRVSGKAGRDERVKRARD